MTSTIRPEVLQSRGYQPGMQPLAPVAKLNTNESPYPPTRRVTAALREAARSLNRYPDPDASLLCQAAAKVYGVTPDMVLACNGGDEVLSVVMRAMIGPGDAVAILEPTYLMYAALAGLQGAVCVPVPWMAARSGSPPVQAKLSFVARPNSPCGTILPLEAIAAWPGPLLVDEAYVEFGADSVTGLLAAKPDLMILRTLSKAYGLAGLRVGFLVARPELIRQMAKVRGVYTVDRLAAAAGVAALEDGAHLKRTVRKIGRERCRLARALRGMGFKVDETPTNFLWFAVPDRPRLGKELQESGIHVRTFDLASGPWVRVSVGSRADNDWLLEALQRSPGSRAPDIR